MPPLRYTHTIYRSRMGHDKRNTMIEPRHSVYGFSEDFTYLWVFLLVIGFNNGGITMIYGLMLPKWNWVYSLRLFLLIFTRLLQKKGCVFLFFVYIYSVYIYCIYIYSIVVYIYSYIFILWNALYYNGSMDLGSGDVVNFVFNVSKNKGESNYYNT